MKKYFLFSIVLLFLIALLYGSLLYLKGVPRYVIALRTDPILSLEGTDTEKLTTAINTFKSARSFLVSAHASTTKSQEALMTLLFPSYLEELIPLEERRNALLESESLSSLLSYDKQLRKTLTQYIFDVERQIQFLKENEQVYASTTFYLPANRTTVVQVRKALEEISWQAKTVLEKESNRLGCVFFLRKNCTVAVPKIDASPFYTTISETLVKSVSTNVSIIKSGYTGEGGGVPTDFGPLYALSNSSCVPFEPAIYLMSWRAFGDGSLWGADPESVNDLFFRVRGESTLELYGEAGIETPAPLHHQQLLTPYFCTEAGSEFARILALHSIAEKLRVSGALKEGGGIVTEAEVASLLKNNLPGIDSEKELRIWNTRSGVLPELLLSIARRDLTEGYRAHALEIYTQTPALRLLMLRGHQTALFLTFNRTLINPAPSFATFDTTIDLNEKLGLTSYSDVLSYTYSPAQMAALLHQSELERLRIEGLPRIIPIPTQESQHN